MSAREKEITKRSGEATREERIGSWRDFQKAKAGEGDKEKEKEDEDFGMSDGEGFRTRSYE